MGPKLLRANSQEKNAAHGDDEKPKKEKAPDMKKHLLATFVLLLFALPGHAQIFPPTVAPVTGTITTAAGSSVQIPITGMSCVAFVLSGTWTGALHAQTTNDGINWNDADTFQQSQGVWLTFPRLNGRYYSGQLSGTLFRLFGPVATGSASVSMQATPGNCLGYTNSIPNLQIGNGTFVPTAATAPIITTPDVVQGQASADVFVIWSGITGAPANCFLQPQASGDGVNFISVGPLIPLTPGTNQAFNITGPFGAQSQIVYLCGTYPTGGTIFIQLEYKQTPPGGPQLSKCTTTVPISIGAAGTQQLITPSAGKKIFVCNLVYVESVAGTVQLTEGTGATCGTGTTNLSGAMSPSVGTVTAFAAGAGTSVFQTNVAGDGLCIVNGAATVGAGMASVNQF